jgi:hypothetical protein
LRSPEHEELLNELMKLADLDDNGTIDKEELTYNKKAYSLLKDYYNKVDRDFLTKGDIVELIPELKNLKNLVKQLKGCLSHASYDPYLRNMKIKPVNFFCVHFVIQLV